MSSLVRAGFLHTAQRLFSWHFSWKRDSGNDLITASHFEHDGFDRYFSIVFWPDVDGNGSNSRLLRFNFGVADGDFVFCWTRGLWLAAAGGDSFVTLFASALLSSDRRLFREDFDRFMRWLSVCSGLSCIVWRRLFFEASMGSREELLVFLDGRDDSPLTGTACLAWLCASPEFAFPLRICVLSLSAFLARFGTSTTFVLPFRFGGLSFSAFLARLSCVLPLSALRAGTLSAPLAPFCCIGFVRLLSGTSPFAALEPAASANTIFFFIFSETPICGNNQILKMTS